MFDWDEDIEDHLRGARIEMYEGQGPSFKINGSYLVYLTSRFK